MRAKRSDLALARHVVREVPDPRRFLAEAHAALRDGGTLLLAEPRRHVSEANRAALLALAQQVGFRTTADAAPRSRRPAALVKG